MIIDDINERRWKTIKSEYLIRRPWLTARRDTVELPNGNINPEFYVLEYPAWVNILAITKDKKFVMIRQFRYGLNETRYELCAGVVDPGETPLEAAKRELWEETGYGNGKWEKMVEISANPSTTNNLTYCYVATDVELISSQHLEKTEDISVHLLTVDEVRTLLLDDKIKQALMLVPLWRYFALNKLI